VSAISSFMFIMETFASPDDPLMQEIASLERAIVHDNADIAELESLLVQKKQNIQMLSVEMRALKRASALRPISVVKGSNPDPATQVEASKGIVAPLRGNENRTGIKTSDGIFGTRQKTADSTFK
jgi:hypothetical protein